MVLPPSVPPAGANSLAARAERSLDDRRHAGNDCLPPCRRRNGRQQDVEEAGGEDFGGALEGRRQRANATTTTTTTTTMATVTAAAIAAAAASASSRVSVESRPLWRSVAAAAATSASYAATTSSGPSTLRPSDEGGADTASTRPSKLPKTRRLSSV